MLNVLSIVSYNFLPAKMGGQKGIALFNQYFSTKVNLTCVTTKSNNITCANYKVLNIFTNSSLRYINVFYFFTLKKIIQQNAITHIIVEHPYYGWLGVMLQKFCKVKMIIHSHNIEALRFKSLNKKWWKILWYYEKWAHQQANYSFFITSNDRDYALQHYKLKQQLSTVITYGFNLQQASSQEEKSKAKKLIKQQYNISSTDVILFFNGTLSYVANLNALDIILQKINPILLQQQFNYKIIICGKDLPQSYNQLKDYAHQNIIYAAFVDDIMPYYLATDIFINPVNDGGGIKTKIVEALGYNVSLVTTQSGAIGIPQNIVENKMIVIDDNDWNAFAQAIINIDITATISQQYFDYFYWDNIAAKASNAIANC